MKKFLVAFALLLPYWLIAQNTAGVVTYAEVTKMKFTPPADMDPAMKASIEQMMKNAPKSFTSYKELNFNPEIAYYKISPKQEKLDAERAAKENMETPGQGGPGGPGGGGFRRMMMNSKSIYYWDLHKSKYVEKREFFEKEFLVKDDCKKLTWKILGDAKEIAGYVCQKASTKIDTTEVIAWFCPTIPVPSGPNGFGQLPGLIMEVQMDERTTITADSVELKPINTADFEQPKGGKVVNRTEYDQIVKEKMDEMRAEWKGRMGGGGGQVRMMGQ